MQHTNSRSHELVQKIRWLCLQHTNSRTRAKNHTVVFATHELTKSRTHAKKQAVVFATHELTKSRACAKNQVVVFATHELVSKIRQLCLQHMNEWTHKHTILRKRCGAGVCCINARSHKLTIFPEKRVLGLFATTNQLAKSEKKIKSVMSLWLGAKMSLLFLYFQSVQVTNSRTWDCWLEFVSSCVHNPNRNRLSLNLFRTSQAQHNRVKPGNIKMPQLWI